MTSLWVTPTIESIRRRTEGVLISRTIAMLIFIDDSGDPGFKFKKGSTRSFVVLLLIFKNEQEAEKTTTIIKALKQSLGFAEGVEFKFHKSSRRVREKFLRVINNCEFQIQSVVIDKALIRSGQLTLGKTSFYSYAIQIALEGAKQSILGANVWIDGGGGRIFKRNFTAHLRQNLNTKGRKFIENCKIVNSKGNELIQMADMLAGAIRISYDTLRDDGAFYKSIIKKHIRHERQFPDQDKK